MNNLIPPEIVNDEFARTLEWLIAAQPVTSILELGASSGEGSTACFMRGLHHNHTANLFSLEASKERFTALQQRYENRARITCINAFSVPVSEWLTHSDIDLLVSEYGNEFGSATYKQWLQQEIDYQAQSGVPTDGIAQAVARNEGKPFDVVLIDSSLFSGMAELRATLGAKFIALDDIRSMKNGPNVKRLTADPRYKLLARGHERYSWAVFNRTDC